jgi:FkbM family methyltransferase
MVFTASSRWRTLSSEESWLADAYPRSGRLFVDVGANVGQWTKPLAVNYERVIAIEPDPRACAQLETNLPKNVRVMRKAVWSTEGVHTLNIFSSTRHGSIVRETADEQSGPRQGHLEVETITLDSLNLEGVDFVKVDTEGAEYEILKGAIQTLKRSHPKLLIEIHNKENGEAIPQFLSSLGYQVRVIRHPEYAVGSEAWLMHFWLSC